MTVIWNRHLVYNNFAWSLAIRNHPTIINSKFQLETFRILLQAHRWICRRFLVCARVCVFQCEEILVKACVLHLCTIFNNFFQLAHMCDDAYTYTQAHIYFIVCLIVAICEIRKIHCAYTFIHRQAGRQANRVYIQYTYMSGASKIERKKSSINCKRVSSMTAIHIRNRAIQLLGYNKRG